MVADNWTFDLPFELSLVVIHFNLLISPFLRLRWPKWGSVSCYLPRLFSLHLLYWILWGVFLAQGRTVSCHMSIQSLWAFEIYCNLLFAVKIDWCANIMIDFPNWGQPILSVTNLSIGKACFILSLIFQPLWKRCITCQTADYTKYSWG